MYIVTGISRGLGKAIVEQLLKRGEKVIGIGRKSDLKQNSDEFVVEETVEETVRTSTPAPEPDSYLNKMAKLVPAEIIAAFLAIDNLIKSADESYIIFQWVIFGVLLLITPFYIKKVIKS